MKKLILIMLPVVLLLGNCKKGTPVVPPFATTLIVPLQNEVCTQGTILSPTESTVTLKWNASLSTDGYDVVIKNLLTGTSTTHPTTATQINLTLLRNTPYSWYVISKSNSTEEKAQSPIWKFYNAGPATVSYAPFPADILAPAMNAFVTAASGKVNLTWTGSDADNDIASYSVYFGTTATPVLLKSDITDMFLNDVAVTAGTTYYWKVITNDAKGNVSDSGVFTFRLNQ